MTASPGSSPEVLLEPLGEERMRFDLAPMRSLVDALGHPEAELPTVLVAGTNGKGSVAALLASVVGAAGYRVGLYTSPHLEEVRERVRIDGRSVDPGLLASWLGRVLRAESVQPTYFEALTAAALLGFREAAVDLAILEVGLGGRLDATNVARPTLSLITSIDLDHARILGKTPEAIAFEKAGIFRPGVPALAAETRSRPLGTLRARARSVGADLEIVRLAGDPARGPVSPEGYRDRNRALAAAAARRLAGSGWSRIDETAIRRGIGRLRWPGRSERVILPGERSVLLDCAHNPGAASALATLLEEDGAPCGLLFGCLADKDAEGMLRALVDRVGSIYLATPPETPRGVPARELLVLARKLAPDRIVGAGHLFEMLDRALHRERRLVVTGSFRIVGPARRRLRELFGGPPAATDPLWDDQSG